jgi:hypothetical protein
MLSAQERRKAILKRLLLCYLVLFISYTGLKKNGKLTGKRDEKPPFSRPFSRLWTPNPVFPFLLLLDVFSSPFPVKNLVGKHIPSNLVCLNLTFFFSILKTKIPVTIILLSSRTRRMFLH